VRNRFNKYTTAGRFSKPRRHRRGLHR